MRSKNSFSFYTTETKHVSTDQTQIAHSFSFSGTHSIDRRLVLPVHKSPNAISKSRSKKPSGSTACGGRQSKDNKRIETHDRGAEMLKVLTGQDLYTDGGADSGADN